MQWWENNIPSLRLSRRLADQTVPISHPPFLTSLSPLRFPHGWVPKPQTWTHIASPFWEGEGGYHIAVCAGGGGDPKETGSLGGATPTTTAPRSIFRLRRHCCVVSIPCRVIPGCWGCKVLILASTAAAMTPPLLALAHPCQRPAPAPPLPPPADYRPLQRGDLGQIGVGELTLPPLHTLLRFGLHLMCVHVSWIHAIFDVVVVLVLFSTISLFSPLLLSSVI
jgi:hypothetical protein